MSRRPIHPDDVLRQILRRLDEAEPEVLLFRGDELCEWQKALLESLIRSGLVKRASPAKVAECTGCEENCLMPVHVFPAEENRPARIFISCDKRDDVGRIPVADSQLQQFEVDPKKIVEQLSKSFGADRAPDEIQFDRVYHLANSVLGRRRRALFLVRGATWPDAMDLLGALHQEFEKYPAPLILVPYDLPAPGERQQYEFVSLASMASLSRGTLTIDHDELSRHVSVRHGPHHRDIIPFPAPLDARWEELTISFVNEETVAIQLRDRMEHRTFAEMGFLDGRMRNETANELWGTFRELAKLKGDVGWAESSSSFADPGQLKKWISLIRKKLKLVFRTIPGNPFRPYRGVGRYQTRFILNVLPSAF